MSSLPPKHLRVSLASPGDVADERTLAIKVIEDLQYTPGLTGKITTHTVAWDKSAEGGGVSKMEVLLLHHPAEFITMDEQAYEGIV